MKIWKLMFCLVVGSIFISCESKNIITVNFNDDNIEIVNSSDKTYGNIFIRCRIKDYAFETKIKEIPQNGTVLIYKNDFENPQTNVHLKNNQKIIELEIYCTDTHKQLYEYKYVPITENPEGYTFESGAATLQFFKYSNKGTFYHYTDLIGGVLTKGTYYIENGKIIFNWQDCIWEGMLEDDELNMKFIRTTSNDKKEPNLHYLSFTKITGNSININNKLETEILTDYETSLLIYLRQSCKDEKLLEEYIKIYHEEEFNNVKNDEFLKHEKEDEYKKELQEKLTNISTECSQRLNWFLGDYNFEKKGFNVKFYFTDGITTKTQNVKATYLFNEVEDRENMNIPYLEMKYPLISHNIELKAKLSKSLLSSKESLQFIISMDETEAKKFLEKRDNSKSILCIVYYSIPLKYLDNSSSNIVCQFKKIEVYDNKNGMNKLYSGSIK